VAKGGIDMSENISSIFHKIYQNDLWTNGSGPGSFAKLNFELFEFIDKIRKKEDLTSLTDLGCGDFQLFKKFSFDEGFSYRGYDIVNSIIDENKRHFSNDFTEFFNMPTDLAHLPESELILIKDVLIHLDNENSMQIIDHSLRKSKFVLFVNNMTNGEVDYNADISIGKFRPVDVSLPPFCLDVIERVEYSSQWAYDPNFPLWLAKIMGKKVWPGEKHIQLVRGDR
jgi:hypothetical protein